MFIVETSDSFLEKEMKVGKLENFSLCLAFLISFFFSIYIYIEDI